MATQQRIERVLDWGATAAILATIGLTIAVLAAYTMLSIQLLRWAHDSAGLLGAGVATLALVSLVVLGAASAVFYLLASAREV